MRRQSSRAFLILCALAATATGQDLKWAQDLRAHGEELCRQAFDAADPDTLRREALRAFEEARDLLADAPRSDPAREREIEAELTSVNALSFWTRKQISLEAPAGDEPEAGAAPLDAEAHHQQAQAGTAPSGSTW